jgi:hypothetical protein
MNFLSDAHASSQRFTCKTIRSILYECAAEALRQIVSKRNHGDEITEEDIQRSYQFASRIGLKWADKLIGVNDDVSNMVKLVLSNGDFLNLHKRDDINDLNIESSVDGDSSSSTDEKTQTKANNHQQLQIRQSSNMIPYIKVNKLVGDNDACNLHSNIEIIGTSADWNPLPSCSSSPYIPCARILPNDKIRPWNQLYGNPAANLKSKSDSYIKDQIHILDDLGRRKQTLWRYDWNIIEHFVERLREEGPNGRKRQKSHHIIEVIPKSIIEQNSDQNEIIVGMDSSQDILKDLKLGSKWSQPFGSSSPKKVGRPRKHPIIQNVSTRGRPPASESELIFSVNDLSKNNEMDLSTLEVSMIHPLQTEIEPTSVIKGALKSVGQIHLWEQVKAGEWEDMENSSAKQQKKVIRKAKKRRIDPHNEVSSGSRELGRSKVVHTEIYEKNVVLSRDDQHKKRGIELDLGECTIELYHAEDNHTNEKPSGPYLTLAFRSLECSLSE